MQIVSLSFVAFFAFTLVGVNGNHVERHGGGGGQPVYYTQEKCITKLGTKKPHPVPTRTQAATLTFQLPAFVKSTSTSTVTPSPITSTVVATSTVTTISTASTVTDTLTVTSTPVTQTTSTGTQTATDTSTVTTTTTTTSMGGTTTIAPASSFTPLSQQIVALGDTYSRRDLVKEDEKKAHAGSLMARTVNAAMKLCGGKPKYPQSVKCKELVEKVTFYTITVPSKKTATITFPPSTTTTTSTTTATLTSTVAPPDVSVTVTSTAATSTSTAFTTTTITTTTTTTQTQTQTAQLPSSTVYEACQANNIVNKINDQVIDNAGVSSSSSNSFGQMSATSALDCCQQCQALSLADPTTCFAFVFDNGSNTCYSVTGPGPNAQYTLGLGTDTGAAFTAGNAPGGQFTGTF